MVALLVGIAIASVWMTAALPSWRHQAIREKEAELIFRGEQYARAIRLYQQKMNGALPSNFDDLVSQGVLRRKWKDPMTREDFIPRVGCGAVGIGPTPGVPGAGMPLPPGGQFPPGRGRQQTSPTPTPPGVPQRGQTPIVPGSQPGMQRGGPAVGAGGFGQPTGGGICGVQSKSKATSIKIYNGQQQYDLWQFDTMTAALQFQQSVVRLGGGTAMPGQGMGVPVNFPGGRGQGGPFVPPQGGRGMPRGFTPGGGFGPTAPGRGGAPGRNPAPPAPGGGRG